MSQVINKMGNKIGMLYLIMYSKKVGIFTPFCSAIDFTIKFGPLPMYVIAPKNTEPVETAII